MMPRLSFAAALVALAPERSSATCTAGKPDRAFACAVRGVQPAWCIRLSWCFPAGWSMFVFTQHLDGFHGHLLTCGLESREMALKVAALQCDRAGRPQLQECAAAELYDPDGRPQKP